MNFLRSGSQPGDPARLRASVSRPICAAVMADARVEFEFEIADHETLTETITSWCQARERFF